MRPHAGVYTALAAAVGPLCGPLRGEANEACCRVMGGFFSPLGPDFQLGIVGLPVAACASKAAVKSAISCRRASKVMAGVSDVDVLYKITCSKNDITSFERGYGMIHEDGDNDAIGGNDDERAINNVVEEEDGEQILVLGGNSSSGIKKYRGSNSNDGGNTRDG
ncbi:retrovirus-related pol polyprotein from transposon TNT 1-94, partial [Tanacetum coccineum]